MQYDPSERAETVIQAGISAARDASPESIAAAERAVERAIGHLELNAPGAGGAIISDTLVEIAKMHVRERIQQGKK